MKKKQMILVGMMIVMALISACGGGGSSRRAVDPNRLDAKKITKVVAELSGKKVDAVKLDNQLKDFIKD